jgi:PAS domain-containing protein
VSELRKGERTEEAVRMSEERCLLLTYDALNTSMLGIFILDSDFRVVWMNQILEQYLGL